MFTKNQTKNTIDNEFKRLIPPLTKEEFNQLEQNILSEGIREKIITWNGIIIDGHNRYEIAQKHGLEFETAGKSFPDRDSAKIWIIKNQFGRRNLSAYDRSRLALELEPLISKKAKINQIRTGENRVCQISDEQKIDTKRELATIAGVSHDTIVKVKTIEQKATPEVKEKLSSGEVSINQAYKDIKQTEKKEKAVERTKEMPLPNGKYNVIYADPPWRYDFAETESRDIENQYPTMTIEDIKALPVPVDENAVLFLWATAPKLPEALEVMKSWGFKYITNAVWDKEKIGMGYWFRGQHEFLLVGVKGKFSPPASNIRVSSVYREPRTGHSKKPDYYYSLIESYFPNEKYLEVFARNSRERWVSYGNEIK